MQYLQEPKIIHLFQLTPSLSFLPDSFQIYAPVHLPGATEPTQPWRQQHSSLPPTLHQHLSTMSFPTTSFIVCEGYVYPHACAAFPLPLLLPLAWTLLEPGPGRCSHSQPPWTKPGFPWQPQRVHRLQRGFPPAPVPRPLATLELIPVCVPHGTISKQGRTTALIS